jgi:hypothetical protein
MLNALLRLDLRDASRATGLRARSDSDWRLDGERERRSVSKRERAGRSVSSLSKRDRGRRSSDMMRVTWWQCGEVRRPGEFEDY